jgi:hypothetical protein
MSAADVEGTVLLKDYPLRLWAQQMLHNDELLREFYLLMESEREGPGTTPAELVASRRRRARSSARSSSISTMNVGRYSTLGATAWTS